MTVLLPVYNASSYVRRAVQSVLDQVFSDFELIIIDDGSKDGSVEILSQFSDPRIRLLVHGENRGLIATLNEGIAASRGIYVARMDADDICKRDRLQVQWEFLQAHHEVGVVGGAYETIGEKRSRRIYLPEDDAAIRCRMLFASPFAHPAVMMRASLLKQHNYPTGLVGAEDMALWIRLSGVTQMANLPEVLLKYRIHEAQESKVKAAQKMESRLRIFEEYLKGLGCRPTIEQLQLHAAIATGTGLKTEAALVAAGEWLGQLEDQLSTKLYPELLKQECSLRWFIVCGNSGLGRSGWKILRDHPLSHHLGVTSKEYWKARIKLLLQA